jgi:hypothetical protein
MDMEMHNQHTGGWQIGRERELRRNKGGISEEECICMSWWSWMRLKMDERGIQYIHTYVL